MGRATKSVREIELEESIVQAVATLDDSDASRVGTLEAIDSAREVLGEAYGTGFEKAVKEYLETEDDDDDDDDDFDDEIEENE